MGLKMPSSKKMRELTGERRSPSKSRERRLAEVAWMVAVQLEQYSDEASVSGRTYADAEELRDLANMLEAAIQELRK